MLDLLDLLKEDQENIRQFSSKQITEAEFIDRENHVLEKFKTYLTSEGFPLKDVKGDEAYKAAVALTLHSDIETLKMVQDSLKNAAPEQYDRKHLAYITDKMLVHEGKPQVYGTQFKRLPDGTVEFLLIENVEEVDSRREEAGLQVLSEYKKIAEDN